jgi:hypothetical protein
MKLKFKEFFLTKMPQHYKGEVMYQKDTKFREVSLKNIQSMDVIGDDNEFLYVVHPSQTLGYVFDKDDFTGGKKHIRPIMSLALRDSGINGLKQVHKLRIQKGYARTNITTTWYYNYINEFGAIVSDTHHLEGGKILWRSFIDNPNFNVDLYDTTKGEVILKNLDKDTNDDLVWSTDDSKTNLVMILTNK